MFVEEYLRRKPTYFTDADTYVCESRYLGRQQHFKRILNWPFPDEVAKLLLESTERKEKLNPAKVVSEFVAGAKEPQKVVSLGISTNITCAHKLIISHILLQKADSEDREETPALEESLKMRNLPPLLDVHREQILERRQPGEDRETSTSSTNQQANYTYYMQMEYSGNYYRLGDGVLVFREGKPHCEVMRIDRMWETSR
jgi:hypothetical protein